MTLTKEQIQRRKKLRESMARRKKVLAEQASKLQEDIQSSLPVQPLPENEVVDYINDIPVAKGVEMLEDGTIVAKARPTCFFKLGYFRELKTTDYIAAKFRGGRGSKPEDPRVRVFKATEYTQLYTGCEYKNLGANKRAEKQQAELGIAQEPKKQKHYTFTYDNELSILNKIKSNGEKRLLQAYLKSNCKAKSQYYISINDSDLTPATKEEVAQYLTPSKARDLYKKFDPATSHTVVNAESGEETVLFSNQLCNTLNTANIYMIGDLGHSIL